MFSIDRMGTQVVFLQHLKCCQTLEAEPVEQERALS